MTPVDDTLSAKHLNVDVNQLTFNANEGTLLRESVHKVPRRLCRRACTTFQT